MAYNTIARMAQDGDLQQRFIACASQELEGNADPRAWVLDNIWELVSSGTLAADYQFALDGATINVNPATGMRDDVINDGAIQTAVLARIAELAQP